MTGRTMASLNDTLTLGLILILLFGAASLYLYTRIQQNEQKLNLVESILLDIKMSAELREYPKMEEQQSLSQQSVPLYANEQTSPLKDSEPFEEMKEEELYQSALEEAAQEVEDVSAVDVSDLLDSKQVTVEKTSPKAKTGTPVVTKLTANYESMTLAELKALGKQRNISGASSMKRSQILEALRSLENPPVDGGVLSALSEQAEVLGDN
jgi:hypothetical protein